jgi:O-methyltransferase
MMKIIKFIIKKFLSFFNLEIVNKKFHPAKWIPIEINKKQINIINTCIKFSMTTELRMSVLINLVKLINKNKVQGDFVECGVWRGGNIILFQKLIEYFSIKNKMIYGFDTFDGMTPPSKFDIYYNNRSAKSLMNKENKNPNLEHTIHAICSLNQVKKNISNTTKNNCIKLIQGDVKKTLKINKNLPEKISILRLDTDFYDSTKIELEILYPRVQSGGILIIDDYGEWQGAKKAVDEYFGASIPFLHIVDRSCRYLIKK